MAFRAVRVPDGLGHDPLRVGRLFPRDLAGPIDPEGERKIFLVAFLILLPVDIVEAILRKGLFSPWYYLPSMASWAAASIALVMRQRRVERLAAWYVFLSIPFFALIARRVLPS